MKEKHSNSYYLDKAPVHKSIMHLSIPMMLGMSAGTLYNLINAFFIGLVHDTGMFSAITLGLPIFTVLMAFGNMFGVGGGTFITRLAATGEKQKAKRVAGYSFYSSLGIGLLIALIAWLFITPIVQGLGADQAVYEYTSQYAITLLAGGAIVILNFALEQLVRSEGASKESMIGMFISIAASIVLDVLLILVLNWHVIGAALSIVLANACSAAYYVWFLSRRSENLRGFLGHWKLRVKDQMEVFKIGVSELLQTSFLIVSTLLLNHYAMIYGESVVAGFGIALRVVQLPEFLAMGIFMGIIPLVAHSFASKKFGRLKATYKQASLYIIGIGVLFIGIVYMFKESVIRLFSSDIAVLEAGSSILVAMLISALFTGLTGLFTGIFKAAGEGIPTNVMAICQGTLFIPVIIVFHQFYGLTGIIWSMTVTEIITSALGLILFAYHYRRINRMHKQVAV
ncbi:MATE family efflux transporter [Paenibacillus xylanexedens]|uniref:MATE family efflux transporter n=1 Tax=Paenibacillus xylanexedens TaxID=528191 RepID=UPI0011AA5AB9|nr:MATE family efflux transporter [Paenibacillus xylanexedens]